MTIEVPQDVDVWYQQLGVNDAEILSVLFGVFQLSVLATVCIFVLNIL